ncbi:MAG: hypothetical protein LKH74_06495 [Levilactobacillus sp.]|uniref:hypothetical protein n=1 Tax=Levilactobacillus sp. TaxID=2767919 RepID=UPI002587E3C8|nr:hypothetical protein [Levilactobacillus sp.]MCI1553561.1 hypothetical protein [Levilactobacillus sp.]MCI1597950.1 hypothetical protein [Levilactobacillus sp.]MCI1605966.1 hypothetical protein [Levilactobacillus sp.]
MKRSIGMLLLLVSLGGGLTMTQPAMAQGKRTLRSFPKRFRGTWYTYDSGRYHRIKITAKTMRSDGWTYRLHSRSVSATGNPNSTRHQHWIIATVGKKWLWTSDWNQTMGYGSYYGKQHRRLNGKNYAALQMAHGRNIQTDGYAYHSKATAKRFANQ